MRGGAAAHGRRGTRIPLGVAARPTRQGHNAAPASARTRRRPRPAVPALAAALMLLTGCGGSSPRSTAAESSTSGAEAVRFQRAHRGVCEAAADVERAEAIFFDRAHDALHELAAALAETDRASAARLLTAKEAVEADLEAAARPDILRDHLLALVGATSDALDRLGIERRECER